MQRRRDAVIRSMLNTPPKPHSEIKIGNGSPKARSAALAQEGTIMTTAINGLPPRDERTLELGTMGK